MIVNKSRLFLYMEVVILAGGFGTRLQHIISDVPKPMAPVCNRPFLEHILEYLRRFDVKKVVMATGYKSDVIREHFGNNYKGIEIIYSVEKSPLGTGGAIKKALSSCSEKNVCVLNGDTYFDVDLKKMFEFHEQADAIVTMGIKEMINFDRYGSVEIDIDRIVQFNEKKQMKIGYINTGSYIIDRNVFDEMKEENFSFEKDFLEKFVNKKKFVCFRSGGYFIDIGIPEDYYKANKEMGV